MNIGYARLSTLDQNLNLQIDALSNVGCERIVQEKNYWYKISTTTIT